MPNSLLKAIKEETSKKHIPILDAQSQMIYNVFNELFRKEKQLDQELEFEKQIFTRGTDKERTGLHTSAIIVSEDKYCCREQVLSSLYKPKDMDKSLPINTLRLFEEGNYIHRKWQRLFLRGFLCSISDLDHTQYNEKYKLSFSPDAIITINSRAYIVEIKSMNEHIYKKNNGQQPSAEKQAQMYMFLSGIRYAIILVENKNNQDFTVKVIQYDPQSILEYISRLEEIKSYYESKEMPQRDKQCITELSKRCLDCPQSIACWGSKDVKKGLKIDSGV